MPRQLETNDQIEDALLDQIIRFKFARPDDAFKQPNKPLRMAKICGEIETNEANNAPEGERSAGNMRRLGGGLGQIELYKQISTILVGAGILSAARSCLYNSEPGYGVNTARLQSSTPCQAILAP